MRDHWRSAKITNDWQPNAAGNAQFLLPCVHDMVGLLGHRNLQRPPGLPVAWQLGRQYEMIESADEFFGNSGSMPRVFHDQRRFPRFYLRACADATIYPLEPDAEPMKCVMVTRDVSRGGMGLLHTAQLFPGQRIDLVLNGTINKLLEVVWCRRVAENSYSIGCRFKEIEPAQDQ